MKVHVPIKKSVRIEMLPLIDIVFLLLVFFEALKMANHALPEQTLFVGDNLLTDIEGALAAGMIPIFMNPDDDVESPAGVVKIRQLSELLHLLNLTEAGV